MTMLLMRIVQHFVRKNGGQYVELMVKKFIYQKHFDIIRLCRCRKKSCNYFCIYITSTLGVQVRNMKIVFNISAFGIW